MRRPILVSLIALAVASALSSAAGAAHRPAPTFTGLGNHHHAVTTRSKAAQKFFDQGLALAFAFNHAEAGRSFAEVARLDAQCAMAWWGTALVLGPNINAPMDTAVVRDAYAAAQKALALAARATPRERAYIEALAKRYGPDPAADRKALDEAYAAAMADVAARFPEDDDAATLAAEAQMDLHPWNYWTKAGEAQPWTPAIVSGIEKVLKRSPDHVGAIHLYIHAVEASMEPGRAEPYADRLAKLMPGAGHIVHMPSHVYIRTGRYHDAALANLAARKVDEDYVTQCHAQGIYPLGYVPHNHHFLWAAATMEGWSAMAFEAAGSTDRKTAHHLMRDPGMGTLQHYALTPLYARVRFGKWDEILATPAPEPDLLYPTGIWHFARGRALVAKGKLDEAQGSLAALEAIAQRDTLEKITIWEINTVKGLLGVAVEVLAGELAAARGDHATAIARLEEGVRREDALNYNEPADWYYPVRHSLGAVLLSAGRPADAEAVYEQDLKYNPENGWSLFGLMKSLEAQNRAGEAAAMKARFEHAWKNADVVLTASRF